MACSSGNSGTLAASMSGNVATFVPASDGVPFEDPNGREITNFDWWVEELHLAGNDVVTIGTGAVSEQRQPSYFTSVSFVTSYGSNGERRGIPTFVIDLDQSAPQIEEWKIGMTATFEYGGVQTVYFCLNPSYPVEDGVAWLYYYGPASTGDAEEHKIYRRQPSDTAGTNIELVFSNDPEVPDTGRSNLGVYLPENVIGMVYSVSSGWVHEGDLTDGTTSIDIIDPETWPNSIVEDPYTQEGRWQWYSDDTRKFCNFGGGTISSLGNAGVGTGFPNTIRVDNRRGTLFTAKYHASGGQWIRATDNWIHRVQTDVIAPQTYDPQYMDLDEEAGLLFFWDRAERSVYKVDYSDRDAWPVTPTKIVDHGAGTAVTANLCVDPIDQKVYYVFDGNLRECGYDGSGDTALWTADNVPHRLVRDGRTFGNSLVTLPLITYFSAVYWFQQMNLDGTGATVGVGRCAELNASFDAADFTYDNEYQRLLMATSGTSAGSVQIIDLSTGNPRSWITDYQSPQVTRFYAGVGWDDDYYYSLYSNEIFRIARSADWDTQKAESSWTSVTTIGSGDVVGLAVVPAAQAYNSEMFFYNRAGNVYSNNSTNTSESTIGSSQNGGTGDDYAIDVSPSNKISFTTANGNTVGVLVWTKGNGAASGLRSVGLATFSPTVDPSTTAREEFITATSGEEVTHVQLDATNSKLYVLVKTASGFRLESYDLTTVASTDEVTISGKTIHQTVSGTTWGDGYFNRFAIVEANV